MGFVDGGDVFWLKLGGGGEWGRKKREKKE